MIKFRLSRNLFNTVKVSIRHFSKSEPENLGAIRKRGWPLKELINKLEFFAPLENAEKWDNVGLIIEPYQKKEVIKRIFLTNDLTLKVMEEAVDKNIDLIISYHPPIFAPLKRISQDNWKAQIVSICLAKGIYVYSPHTAWDCAPYGESINHWLSRALKPNNTSKPIIINNPETITGPGLIWTYPPFMNYKISQVIEGIQNYIELPVQVALGVRHSLDTVVGVVACCAGSGASLLKEVTKTDVYITGEMSHHELLDAQHRNITVILCNHSNSERGFLKQFQKKLENMLLLGRCEVFLSECDKDPLETFFFKMSMYKIEK